MGRCHVETLIRRCAGLDVHKASVVACVRLIDENGELVSFTQSFGTTTSDLLKLNDWLMSYSVTIVGMESTGVYWKPVYTLLETEFECWLLNAQHLRNVPGRKTDVADAAWIAQLVAHGLVRPSFVPPKEIRELREVTRYRKALIQERTREAQRLHKIIERVRHQTCQRCYRHFRSFGTSDAQRFDRRDTRSGDLSRIGPRQAAQKVAGVAKSPQRLVLTHPPSARWRVARTPGVHR